jgi:anti-sigma B factor antagonist
MVWECAVFEMAVTAHAGRVVVAVAGDVDMLTAGRLREGVAEAVRVAGAGPVIVDLERVPFLDSSGIQALLDGYHTAMVAGGTLTVRGANGTVARVLQIVGLDRVLGVGVPETDPLDVRPPDPVDPGTVDPGAGSRPRELERPGSS